MIALVVIGGCLAYCVIGGVVYESCRRMHSVDRAYIAALWPGAAPILIALSSAKVYRRLLERRETRKQLPKATAKEIR